MSNGAFVATDGIDAPNAGTTPTNPCQSIDFALGRAQTLGRSDIYLQAGDYTGTLLIASAVNLYGGYDANWQREANTSPGHTVRLWGVMSTNEAEYAAVIVRATTSLSDLEIHGPTATGTETGGYGRSAYAVHVQDAALTVSRCVIVAGDGGGGDDGVGVGAAGDGGGDGQSGYNGYEDDAYFLCSGNVPDPPLVSAGGISCAAGDSRGGDGKRGCKTNGSNCAGISGDPGSTSGASAGVGGLGQIGNAGGDGQPGTSGAQGAHGSGGAGGTVIAGLWVANGGSSGAPGQDGGGGGGGAGGGSTHSTGTCNDWGGGGAGGGAGGCAGGDGGEGGEGGAGSGGAGGYSVCVYVGSGSSWSDGGSSNFIPGPGGTSPGNAGATGISTAVLSE